MPFRVILKKTLLITETYRYSSVLLRRQQSHTVCVYCVFTASRGHIEQLACNILDCRSVMFTSRETHLQLNPFSKCAPIFYVTTDLKTSVFFFFNFFIFK